MTIGIDHAEWLRRRAERVLHESEMIVVDALHRHITDPVVCVRLPYLFAEEVYSLMAWLKESGYHRVFHETVRFMNYTPAHTILKIHMFNEP